MIIINGNNLQEEEIVLVEYLKRNYYDKKKIAVEKNGVIVPRREYESEIFKNGDIIEIVQFVGGVDSMKIPTKEEMRMALEERHTVKIQKKISQARVAVCGLGGLGSTVAVLLARAGIGTLHLLDFDRVELSNLNRQQYLISQVGKCKTDALEEVIKKIAPYCKIITSKVHINSQNISELLMQETIVCEAFDSAENKALLVNYLLENRPEVSLVAASGMAGYGRSNQIHTRKIGSCFYLCGDEASDCNGEIGLMAPRVALCAAHQANQILELIIEKNQSKKTSKSGE